MANSRPDGITTEIIERRTSYLAQKRRENASVTTLAEEQHQAINNICEMRHQLHTFGGSLAVLCGERAGAMGLWLYSSAGAGDGAIMDTIRDAGLPPLDMTRWDLLDVYDYETAEFDDRTEEQGLADNARMIDEINNALESWLQAIDAEHGTDYAPSGGNRVWMC